MSEVKHTEGPWLLAEQDPQFVYKLGPEGYNRFYFRVHGPHTPTAELEAVARVARAAPDLLYALEMATQWIEHFQSNGNAAQTLRDARAAIAKATGSQQ